MSTIRQRVVSRVKDWLRPHVMPRRFHAFGVGMPKTGTHSLAAVFSRYRSLHEPERQTVMRIIMERADGTLPEPAARDQLRRWDRHLWVELNSSWTNYLLLDMLLEEYPQAKFVLTIRDCYSWLDSLFNELLGRNHADYMVHFHRWYAASLSPGPHMDGDRVLAERGLWPLDIFLRAWHLHNAKVIDMVPSNRLLVVRTRDIRGEIPRLAEFLEIPADTLDPGGSHEFKAEAKFGLLSGIDENYLHACVQTHCADLMAKYFPEIRRFSDVPGYRPRDARPAVKAS